ncbi:hypothetical protein D5R81_19880, partial [Parashewanella spongiae]
EFEVHAREVRQAPVTPTSPTTTATSPLDGLPVVECQPLQYNATGDFWYATTARGVSLNVEVPNSDCLVFVIQPDRPSIYSWCIGPAKNEGNPIAHNFNRRCTNGQLGRAIRGFAGLGPTVYSPPPLPYGCSHKYNRGTGHPSRNPWGWCNPNEPSTQLPYPDGVTTDPYIILNPTSQPATQPATTPPPATTARATTPPPTEVRTTPRATTAEPTEAETTQEATTPAPTEAVTTQETTTPAPTEAETTQETTTTAPTEAETTQETTTPALTEAETTQEATTPVPTEAETTQEATTPPSTEARTTPRATTPPSTEARTTPRATTPAQLITELDVEIEDTTSQLSTTTKATTAPTDEVTVQSKVHEFSSLEIAGIVGGTGAGSAIVATTTSIACIKIKQKIKPAPTKKSYTPEPAGNTPVPVPAPAPVPKRAASYETTSASMNRENGPHIYSSIDDSATVRTSFQEDADDGEYFEMKSSQPPYMGLQHTDSHSKRPVYQGTTAYGNLAADQQMHKEYGNIPIPYDRRKVYANTSGSQIAESALHGNDTGRQSVNHVQEGDYSYARGATFNSGNVPSSHEGRHVYNSAAQGATASKQPALHDTDRYRAKLVQEGYYSRPRATTSDFGSGMSSHGGRHVYERVPYDTAVSKQPAPHGNDTSRQGVNHVQEGYYARPRDATSYSGNGTSTHGGRHVYERVSYDTTASKQPALHGNDTSRQGVNHVQEGD